MKWRLVLLVLATLAFRLFNAFSLATFFQPDEFFQSYEPAHKLVYGYGYTTWEWHLGVRGSLHPLVYAFLFRLSNTLGVSHLVVAKCFNAVVAAVADLNMLYLALHFGEPPRVALLSFAVSLASAWNWFCSTRAFSNTIEMALSSIALTMWPLRRFKWSRYLASLVVANIAIALRPTNALLWAVLAVRLCYVQMRARRVLFTLKVILSGLTVCALAAYANFSLDCWFYGRKVVPVLEFVRANFGQSVSHFYGVMPWHFYLHSALPITLMGYLPLFLLAVKENSRSLLVRLFIGQIFVLSLLAHKEWRFIYFLLPLMHILVAKVVFRGGRLVRYLAVLALSLNIVVGFFFSSVHQRGVMDVMDWLADGDVTSVSFLMPCHSTPWAAHVHRELDMRMLTCEPPISVPPAMRASYLDEADQFYKDPLLFVEEHPDVLKETLVVFESLLKEPMHVYLLQKGYVATNRFFNSYFHDDWRRRGDIIVFTRVGSVEGVIEGVSDRVYDAHLAVPKGVSLDVRLEGVVSVSDGSDKVSLNSVTLVS